MQTPAILAAVFTISLSASAASLTLQQGQAGYSACTDSFVVNGGYGDDRESNFGDATSLYVSADHYNPG